jgi:hypothetical protein
VNLTAVVSLFGETNANVSPTGNVMFSAGGQVLGSPKVDKRQASLTTQFNVAGQYDLRAEYKVFVLDMSKYTPADPVVKRLTVWAPLTVTIEPVTPSPQYLCEQPEHL